jgi:predicted translin family RNA/ssDNA-binding protein
MTGRATGVSPSIPEPHREAIIKLAERVYKGSANQTTALNLSIEEVDRILQDIHKAIEDVNAALKGTAWSEAYTSLVTLKEVVQNFSASLSMRRASIGQYDTVWPGTRWKG